MRIAMMTNNYKPFVGGVPISIERLADSPVSYTHLDVYKRQGQCGSGPENGGRTGC